MTDLPRTMAIAGLGLMGGSLARALRRRPYPPRITGIDTDPAALRAALADGIIDHAAAALGEVAADLLVLAMPVGVIAATLRQEGSALSGFPAITDTGSVKVAICQAAADGSVADRFAGSHPLCGDHRSGFSAGRADLYDGRTVYVVADSPASPRAAAHAMWRAAGAATHELAAAEHDALVARTSHLPQLAASALAAALADLGATPEQLGSGGLDSTRIAASSPDMWLEILLHNRAALAAPLEAYGRCAAELRSALEDGDAAALHALLARASSWRAGAGRAGGGRLPPPAAP
jgi:prephenate dehydrogenase